VVGVSLERPKRSLTKKNSVARGGLGRRGRTRRFFSRRKKTAWLVAALAVAGARVVFSPDEKKPSISAGFFHYN
jgi:hypothetical protein